MKAASCNRLEYLDSLRGLGALSVAVFSHYICFVQPFIEDHKPVEAFAYQHIHWIYDWSWTAVELFFALSGIVFAHVYGSQRLSAFQFGMRRFARLYSLHLVTLVVVAVAIFAFQHVHGRPPLRDSSDFKHFMMNVLFIQYGIVSDTHSFNEPSWSLSIEAAMYALFFVVQRYLDLRICAWILCMSAATLFYFVFWPHVWLVNYAMMLGLMGFFGGVIIWTSGRWAYALPVIFALLATNPRFPIYPVYAAVFSLLLILRDWPRAQRALTNRPLAWLGARSLAVYLIHFPLQIIIMLVFGTSLPLGSPWMLLGYALAVLVVAHCAHKCLELPAHAWIGRRTDTIGAVRLAMPRGQQPVVLTQ